MRASSTSLACLTGLRPARAPQLKIAIVKDHSNTACVKKKNQSL